jgi:hypothetical protein
MESAYRRVSPYSSVNKRNILIGAVLWNVASDICLWAGGFSQQVGGLVLLIFAVGNAVAILLWCHQDATEYGVKLGPGFRILTILLGPIALVYYLFKSRGFVRGLVATGYAALYFLGIIAANFLVNFGIALVSHSPIR